MACSAAWTLIGEDELCNTRVSQQAPSSPNPPDCRHGDGIHQGLPLLAGSGAPRLRCRRPQRHSKAQQGTRLPGGRSRWPPSPKPCAGSDAAAPRQHQTRRTSSRRLGRARQAPTPPYPRLLPAPTAQQQRWGPPAALHPHPPMRHPPLPAPARPARTAAPWEQEAQTSPEPSLEPSLRPPLQVHPSLARPVPARQPGRGLAGVGRPAPQLSPPPMPAPASRPQNRLPRQQAQDQAQVQAPAARPARAPPALRAVCPHRLLSAGDAAAGLGALLPPAVAEGTWKGTQHPRRAVAQPPLWKGHQSPPPPAHRPPLRKGRPGLLPATRPLPLRKGRPRLQPPARPPPLRTRRPGP